jgi:predicted phosphate transport protein (TIGR00153 family)
MAFSLFPREDDFFRLFCKQGELVKLGCDKLHEMMERFDRLDERAKEMKDIEHQADLVTLEIFVRRNRTFITPIEREDIHALASRLDDVMDAAAGAASRIVLLHVAASTPAATQLSGILARCGTEIVKAVDSLKDFKHLMAFTIEINRLENEADEISREATADLFSGRHEVLDVLRWREIYGRLEGASDRCEDVANVIESIVLKSR